MPVAQVTAVGEGDGTPPLSVVERWLLAHARPQPLSSAQALYELMPRQRDGQLPLVDVPYDPRNEAHWADAARIADYAAHAPAGPGSVLDIGPGDGWPSLPIAHMRPDLLVVGVDPSPRRTAVCAANARRLGLPNAVFVTGDGACLPLADGAIDLVTAAASLEEAEDPEAAFAEVLRVLVPGGVLRASYQDWRLEVAELETVLLWGSDELLLYTYSRRLREPPLERRYTVELPRTDEARRAHGAALLVAAEGRRAYGETLLSPALGVELLERLVPLARRTTVVESRRWTTAWLVETLRRVGFSEVRATVHPGELGRHFARDLLRRNRMDAFAPLFAETTAALGRLAGSQPGAAMVTAIR